MKIAMLVFRTLMGALFLFASITFFFKLITPPPMTGAVKAFNEGMAASIYLFPLLKLLELLCGLAFVTGRFVPLATVLIAPIIVNIFCFHAFLDPKGLPVAGFLVVANLVVAWYYRAAYKPLLKA